MWYNSFMKWNLMLPQGRLSFVMAALHPLLTSIKVIQAILYKVPDIIITYGTKCFHNMIETEIMKVICYFLDSAPLGQNPKRNIS